MLCNSLLKSFVKPESRIPLNKMFFNVKQLLKDRLISKPRNCAKKISGYEQH